METHRKSKYSKILPLDLITMNRQTHFPRRVSTIFPQIPVKDLKPKMKKLSFVVLFSSFLCIVLGLDQNLAYTKNSLTPSQIQLSERVTIIILSLVQILALIQYWHLRVKMNEAYNKSYYTKGILSGNNHKNTVIFEFTISSLVYPYNYNTIIYNNEGTVLTLDDLITILLFSRIYFIFKFLYDVSYYNSNRAIWVTNLTNVNNLMSFILKSYFHLKSLIFTLISLALSTVLFGFIIYIVEKNEESLIINFSDSIFLVSVTETTVGFGDILPSNFISKTICVFSSLYGIFLLGLITISVQKSIELDEKESEAFNIVKYSIDCKVLRKQAAKVVQTGWRLFVLRRKGMKRFNTVIKFYLCVKMFKIMRIKVKSMQNCSIKANIEAVEDVSKRRILGFAGEIGVVDEYSQESLRMVRKEKQISDKAAIFKGKCRKLMFLVSKNGKIGEDLDLEKFKSFSRCANSVLEKKKLKDRAVKKVLMNYSQESANVSNFSKSPRVSEFRISG